MKTQWQIYKQLELIPDSVPEPPANKRTFAGRLSRTQRSLIDIFIKKSHKQKVEYLEQHLALNCCEPYTALNNVWLRLWTFLNQPLFVSPLPVCPEPEIWQSLDCVGRVWWHIYDPITGRTIHLESEEEVRIWLEERLYHY